MTGAGGNPDVDRLVRSAAFFPMLLLEGLALRPIGAAELAGRALASVQTLGIIAAAASEDTRADLKRVLAWSQAAMRIRPAPVVEGHDDTVDEAAAAVCVPMRSAENARERSEMTEDPR